MPPKRKASAQASSEAGPSASRASSSALTRQQPARANARRSARPTTTGAPSAPTSRRLAIESTASSDEDEEAGNQLETTPPPTNNASTTGFDHNHAPSSPSDSEASDCSGDTASPVTSKVVKDLRSLLEDVMDTSRPDEWYIVLVAAFASAHLGAEAVPIIYKEAVGDFIGWSGCAPPYWETVSQVEFVKKAVVEIQRRIKEALLKGSVLYGIPPALEAAFSLMAHIRKRFEQTRSKPILAELPEPDDENAYMYCEEDPPVSNKFHYKWAGRMFEAQRDHGHFQRHGETEQIIGTMDVQNSAAANQASRGQGSNKKGNSSAKAREAPPTYFKTPGGESLGPTGQRGIERLQQVYRQNFPDIDARFGDELEDIKLITIPINYGLILSEDTTLDFKSTELVILAALIPQNMRNETLWHLRGCRRAGWSDKVIESVRSVCLKVAELAGRPTDRIPTLADVGEDRND